MNLAHLCLALTVAGAPSGQEDADPFVSGYQAACEARDADSLAELWRAHPERILATFDADLEGGLAAWEESPDAPDTERIAELYARALWAARVASEVTGRPIFVDYASSFVGWGAEEKRAFRGGQQAYGLAREALATAENETALERAQQCRELALPLGDWWGTAMGYSAEGRALGSLGRPAEAAVAFSQARLLYADLGLVGSEYANVRGLAEVLGILERWPRARVAAEDALALAERLGRADDRGDLLKMRLAAEVGLGDLETAGATRAEIEALGG